MRASAEQDKPEFRSLSRSFTLRVWREELGSGRGEWRGRVQNVTSGEVRYFRGWSMLAACIQEMLGSDIEGS
jgi:hypothetical protein